MVAAILGLTLGVLAANTVQEGAQAQWNEFVPVTGLFAIQLPGRPSKEGTRTTTKSAAGDVGVTMYDFEADNAYFAVAIAELPSGRTKDRLPQRLLDDSRDGALANVRGRVTEEFQVFLAAADGKKGAYPGRQITADVPPDLVFRARFFLVDETLIQLMLVQKKTETSPELFLRIADSLRLLR